jgi:UDP-N-acetylglucosamine 2-epimerase (non-hydrolysing)
MTIVGTRPEVIKLSRVIAALDRHTDHVLVHSGQNHDYELNEIFFDELEIRRPDHFLGAVHKTAAETIGAVIARTDQLIREVRPDAVLFYGDTNTCLAVIAAKRAQVPVFHMEAGNRCFDARVPEEINRKVVDHLSDINMTLTEHARRYLLSEGLRPETVFKVGSSMPELLEHYRPKIEGSRVLADLGLDAGGYFVVSSHREENVDEPDRLALLLEAIRRLVGDFDREVVVSTHPRTRKRLEGHDLDAIRRVRFLKPLGFCDYVSLEKSAFCVLSDSGTLTEEASLLKFPAVMIRDAHERPEGMDVGATIMSGLDPDRVADSVRVATEQRAGGFEPGSVGDYAPAAVSEIVVRLILSYAGYVKRTVWYR